MAEKPAKQAKKKDKEDEERLSALDLPAAPTPPLDLRNVPMADIEPMDNIRPAHHGIEGLAETMHAEGQLQPCVVRPAPADAKHQRQFELVFGYRRYLAAKSLGWETLQCAVRDVPNERKRRQLIVENFQRDELSDVAEARAFYELKYSHEPPLSNAEVARLLGCDPSHISHRLKMLINLSPPRPDGSAPYPHELQANKGEEGAPARDMSAPLSLPGDLNTEPPDGKKGNTLDILSLVDDGALSASTAEVIASLDNRRDQEQLARLAIRHDWGVKKAAQWARESKKEDLIKASDSEELGPVEMLQIEDVTDLPRLRLKEVQDEEVEKIVLYGQLRNGMDQEMLDYISEEMGYSYEGLWDYVRGLSSEHVSELKRRMAIRYITAPHRYKSLEPSLLDDLGVPEGQADEADLRLASEASTTLPGSDDLGLNELGDEPEEDEDGA